jgi:integrase
MSGRRRDFGNVRRLPSGRWQARFRDGLGSPRSKTFATRGDASRYLARVRTDIDRGNWFDPDAGRQLLRAYAEDWLDRRRVRGRSLAPRTSERYRTLLRVHILPVLGHLPLSRLDQAAVRHWHSRLLEAEPPGPATVAKTYRLLHAICNSAVIEQKIARNPCMIPGASIETNPERPTATLGQVYRLAEAVGDRWRALVLLGTFCGLRFGELAGLTRADVDLEIAVVMVRADLDELDGDGSSQGRSSHPPAAVRCRSRRHSSTRSAIISTPMPSLGLRASCSSVRPAGGYAGATSASRCGFPPPDPLGLTACASMTFGTPGIPSPPVPAPAPVSSWHAWVTRVRARRSSISTPPAIVTRPSQPRCPN